MKETKNSVDIYQRVDGVISNWEKGVYLFCLRVIVYQKKNNNISGSIRIPSGYKSQSICRPENLLISQEHEKIHLSNQKTNLLPFIHCKSRNYKVNSFIKSFENTSTFVMSATKIVFIWCVMVWMWGISKNTLNLV